MVLWVQVWVVQLVERWEEWLWVQLLVSQWATVLWESLVAQLLESLLEEWLVQMWEVEQLAVSLEPL